MKQKLTGKGIAPKCEYCSFGKLAPDGNTVLCVKKGIVAVDGSCGKFDYDALKRTPKIPPSLPEFTAEDFKL